MSKRWAAAVWLPGLFAAGILSGRPVRIDDGDMERPDLGPWRPYATPVVLEKTDRARTGRRALRVVTDDRRTMGGNHYEGVARSLGRFRAGDTLHVSFWFLPESGRDIVVGIGPTYFMRRWVLGGTDWTHADLTFRVPRDGPYNIWISQHGAPTEFLLDDFSVEVEERPDLGRADPAKCVVLRNGPLSLQLCRETGALCGLRNVRTGEELVEPGVRRPLVRVERLTADGTGYERIGGEAFRLERLDLRSPRAATLTFSGAGGSVRLKIDIAIAADGSAAFSGRLENHGPTAVTAVGLPTLYGVRPHGKRGDLTLVDPHVCGRIVHDAWRSDGCRTTWPGRGVMGWMDVAGDRGGVCLATHDRKGVGTRLITVPAPGERFDMAVVKEILARPGEEIALPPAVLAVHVGDWHAAADRYRAWMRSWQPPPDVPQWLRNCDGWVLTGIQNGIPFRRLPDIYRSAEWMGVDLLHVQGEGIDNMWFDAKGKRHFHAMTWPWPSPRFGTPGELKTAVRRIHARGGRVLFYFLFERWTPSHSVSDDFGTGRRRDVPREFRPPGLDFYYDNALAPAPGVRLPTEHPFMVERVMCLAAPGWREWMRHWAIDVYARRFGADGFYWDVMGRRGPFRCFNARHGHHGENLWAAGCAKVLDTVIRQGRERNPGYTCAIEGCSDFLSPWVGLHLMSGATRTPNVFRYTFPDVICIDGFSNTTWKLTQVQKARRVFLNGERFDLHGMHQAVRPIILLRKRIRPFIEWPAVFRDTMGVRTTNPAVQARLFVRTDGGNAAVAVTLMNETGVKDAEVVVAGTALGGPPRAVHVFRLDGRVQEATPSTNEDGGIHVAVPADAVSAVLLVRRVSPALAVHAWIEQILRPGVDGLRLSLFFPDGKRRRFSLDVTPPSGLEGTFRDEASDSPALVVRELRDARHLRGLTRWRRVDAAVRWNGGEARPWTVIAPPVVNGDFETLDADGRLLYWGVPPCPREPGQGRYCVQVDREHMRYGFVRLLTPLKPGCRYRFRAMVRRDPAASGGAGAHVIEYLEGSRFLRSAVLNSRKSSVWERLETTFTSAPAPRTSAVFLYDFDKSRPAWFDAVSIEEVRE